MARDGSGTYTVPNTFLPNTVMSASAVNQNFTDAGSEITNSLARDGRSAMTGQFKADAGTQALPGITFANDPDSGFRRASSDEIRWVTGATDRFYIDSVGKAWYLGDVSIAGDLNIAGALTGASLGDIGAIEALTGVGLLRRDGANTWALDAGTACITIMKDGVGNELPTGIIGDVLVPFDCEIVAVTVLGDQTGSIVVDIWKDTTANFPPTDADTITASAPPTISNDDHSEDDTLSGWTTAITAGDVLRFNIDSITDITRVTIILHVERYT
jgi:hypothetical protein